MLFLIWHQIFITFIYGVIDDLYQKMHIIQCVCLISVSI